MTGLSLPHGEQVWSPIDKQWSRVDTTVPHSARVWNYWLGGKDNFPADRAAGDRVRAITPDVVEVARASRAFLVRAVEHLAGPAGVRQFLDVGTGLPTANNTHEVAQRVAPTARIVYVDNDPLVLVHARALLTSAPEGATAYIDADVYGPGKILSAAADTLDFTQPVVLMLLGILGHVPDLGEARSIVSEFLDALPLGSYLVISDGTTNPRSGQVAADYAASGGLPYHFRTPTEIASFFDGLKMLEPGIVSTPLWRPVAGTAPAPLNEFCGVGRKP